MKRISCKWGVLLALFPSLLFAQQSQDYAVRMQVSVTSAPTTIHLQRRQSVNANNFTVERKSLQSTNWGSTLAILGPTDTVFTDTNVQLGEAWEYRITEIAPGTASQGYCFAAVQRPAQDYYGKIILVIDTTYADSLAAEINQLEEDLWSDGWQVIKLAVDRNDSVMQVKTQIVSIWASDPTHVRSVFLLGHVPVPYSGNLNPDGHPDHQGAWPADVFYGEMNGAWTDFNINNSAASRQQNRNIPGDGKFDQSSIPSDAELEVGRVDFANMPAFVEGEAALLRRYLHKDHDWRHKAFVVADSAVIDDNFGAFGGEAFAKSGWRNFGPLVGVNNTFAGDFRTELNAKDMLWAYGCGGGWYQGASGVGSSSDFATDSLRGVFTMLFGSYHGDWDSDDNFMRAALASKGHVLSCAWAGRPNWHFQHMGLGEPIGYAARITQNNFLNYVGGTGTRGVHIALMGDPSLRMHVLAPPSNLSITLGSGGNSHMLSWTASPDAVLDYVVYRQDTLDGRYWRIATVPGSSTDYTDGCMLAGDYRYMVRAEELRVGQSGSYYNLSQGIRGSISNTASYLAEANLPNPSTLCLGDSILIPYSTALDFCPANVFVAELSDSTGSFAQPLPIGTLTAFSSDTIHGFIPQNLSPSATYRIRIVASDPAAVGPDNGFDLAVQTIPTAAFTVQPTINGYQFNNQSIGATQYFWRFETVGTSQLESPIIQFDTSGFHLVTLISSNACGSDTATQHVVFVSNTPPQGSNMHLYPNPAQDYLIVSLQGQSQAWQQISVFDLLGNVVWEQKWPADDHLELQTSDWSKGSYFIELKGKYSTLRKRFVLQ